MRPQDGKRPFDIEEPRVYVGTRKKRLGSHERKAVNLTILAQKAGSNDGEAGTKRLDKWIREDAMSVEITASIPWTPDERRQLRSRLQAGGLLSDSECREADEEEAVEEGGDEEEDGGGQQCLMG